MLGLIKKDLLMTKSNIKVLFIILVVYGVMAYQGQMDLSFILPFMSVMLMISTFSYDAYNKWDAYVCCLPNGRKNSVRAKYIATLLLIIVTTAIVTILMIAIAYDRIKSIDLESVFSTILGAVFATTILESFMYPSIYKFGVEKARIGIFIVVFGIAIVGGIIAKYIDFKPMLQKLNNLGNSWMIILPIVMIVILYLSYKISEGIYRKKEY